MGVSISADSKAMLQSIPYFKELDDQALAAVAREVMVRSCQANELIFIEGDSEAGLHLVVEGLAKVYRLSEGGREQILAVLRPGDSCNEVPVVDGGPNPANFAALEDSVVWIISADSLNRLRQQYPALNDIIIKSLALRCRQLVQRVYNLSFLSVTGRLAVFLLKQTDEQNLLSRHRWTQDEIAAHLGTVREMVGRAFKELQAAGLITLDRHQIEILDRDGLKKLT